MAVGAAIGVAMGQHSRLDRLLDPWIILLINIPALVVIVLCYIWIGLTEAAAVTAVALNKIPNVVVTLREGARALDADLLEMAPAFRFSRLKLLRHAGLPHPFPFLPARSPQRR